MVRQGVIDVSPSTGKIFGGEKQRVMVRFSPGLPEVMCERLIVEVRPMALPTYMLSRHSGWNNTGCMTSVCQVACLSG